MVRRKSRGAKEPTAKEIAHAAGVRVEQSQSEFRILLEGFRTLEDSVNREVGSLRGDMRDVGNRLDRVEAAVTQHSAEIRGLRADVQGLRHDFDHREELGRVSALESRVSAIETRLATAPR